MCYRNGRFVLKDNPETLQLGFASLHFGPGTMEMCLNIGGKTPWKRYKVDKDEKERLIEHIKNEIHKQFNFCVNKPLPGSNQGISNTGNDARKFKQNAKGVAANLEIPEDFVKGVRTIWEILRCTFMLDSEKAKEKCEEVLDMYFEYFKITDEEKEEIRENKGLKSPKVQN